ncbi:MAG: FtsX-like permease family protein [Chitinivibrionales bacterium]|nr:FtsX-like permease family protein [Chitinivibrionales bacterium]
MLLFNVSWRNIWRNKLRSFIVVTAVTLGLFGGIFSIGFSNGMARQRIQSAVNNELGHLQIHGPGFPANQDLFQTLDITRFAPTLDSINAIAAWSPRISITAMARSANNAAGVMLLGVHPQREREVTDLHHHAAQGVYLDEAPEYAAFIGKELADKLDLRMHDKIVVTMQMMDSTLTGGAFTIAGLYTTNNSAFDKRAVFVRYGELAQLIALDTNHAHEIAAKLDRGVERGMTIAASLQQRFPQALVRSWQQLGPTLAMLDGFMQTMMALFLAIILLALGFGIVNTMLMAVMERRREFGMLAAIGMSNRRIFGMVLLETIFLSLTGGVLGMVLSAAAIAWFSRTGIDLSIVAQGLTELGYSPVVKTYISSRFYLQLSGGIVLTAILASLYPARKAMQMEPADALRTAA